MAAISEPYRPRPILPLSYGFASSTTSSQFLTRSSFSTGHPLNSISTGSVRSGSTPSRLITFKKPFANDIKNQSNGQKTGTAATAGTKKACLCSPSTHPGAFRCAMHKKPPRGGASLSNTSSKTASSYHSSVRLRYRRSAMNKSLLRIGGVAVDLVKRSLATPRPSGRNQRRRADFKPKPSRLSVMSKE